MTSFLCISVRFLQPYNHGRGHKDEPEWPPSPLRVMQALVAASAGRWNERSKLKQPVAAIRWLESLPPPHIVAADAVTSTAPNRLYVPDNVADKLTAKWARGRDASVADYRTGKDVRPSHLKGDMTHYLYPLVNGACPHFEVLASAAHSVTHLGWGIDMAIGNAAVISPEQAAALPGLRWLPTAAGGTPLRTPIRGTLDDIMRKHDAFLRRITDDGFRPVPPLRVFDVVHYRRQDAPLGRPYRVFELRSADRSRFRYPHRKLIHLAGMVRHMAVEAMKKAPPRDVPDDWVKTYIAGHYAGASAETSARNKRGTEKVGDDRQTKGSFHSDEHRQLSYIPLPSVGYEHTDPGVRRIMIVAPVGDDACLDHLARLLAGQQLIPERGDEFAGHEPPFLVQVPRDNVAIFYTEPAGVWHSFTPVILPGHDDHKPDKTRKLIKKALVHSGIEQSCGFEWSPFSRFSKAYSAHKYDKNKRPQGYIRPGYLLSQTAVHLTIRFEDGLRVPGPITIGAGRHCGFGLMVGEPKP